MKNLVFVLISMASIATNASPKLMDSGAGLISLMKKNKVSSYLCSTLNSVEGETRYIEIRPDTQESDESGITILSSYFYYGNNQITELHVGNTTLITFGDELNYTILLDTNQMASSEFTRTREISAKLIDNEAENEKYLSMNCKAN